MRYLTAILDRALADEHRMAFVSGPRQVGKTTLARHLLEKAGSDRLYFNWDIESHRRAVVKDPSGFFAPVLAAGSRARRPRLVLDEIHKYPRWKRFLKGLFDEHGQNLEILVTGSGRLDVYQRGGDSLLGRYDLYRLHPFTLGEYLAHGRQDLPAPQDFIRLLGEEAPPKGSDDALAELERFTGFPEPLFAGREERLRRWRRVHRQLVIREDLRDLTRIRELGLIESLVMLLPERVGSLLSVNRLAQELGVAFNTVKLWLEALARLYLLFEIRPYSGRLGRSLRREAKVYLFDSTEIADPGARFENVVALHLKKLCDAWNDTGLGDFDLRYLRDKEKREVDFVITERQKPWLLIETKLADPTPSKALRYFAERVRPLHGAVQLLRNHAQPYRHEGVLLLPATWMLARV